MIFCGSMRTEVSLNAIVLPEGDIW